jgi:hypothetical protein
MKPELMPLGIDSDEQIGSLSSAKNVNEVGVHAPSNLSAGAQATSPSGTSDDAVPLSTVDRSLGFQR